MIFDALLYNLPGKQNKRSRKGSRESHSSDLHRLARIKQNKCLGQDKHTPEMHSKLSRRLNDSTLIKMLTETLSVYERGLTLRKKRQHSARAEVTICQVLSRCTQSHRRIACTYAHSLPHMGPLLLQVFFSFCDFPWFSYYITLF